MPEPAMVAPDITVVIKAGVGEVKEGVAPVSPMPFRPTCRTPAWTTVLPV